MPAPPSLYGWTAKEAVGKITHTLLDTTFPSSKEAADEALFQEGYWEGELQHRRKDGTRIVVESRQSLLRDASGKPLLIKEINRDVTQQRRQLSYLRLLGEVSACVNEARTVEEALRRSLASICLQTNWCAGRACTVSRDNNDEIQGTCVWFLSDEKRFGPFRDAMDAKLKFPHEKNVAERVSEKASPFGFATSARIRTSGRCFPQQAPDCSARMASRFPWGRRSASSSRFFPMRRWNRMRLSPAP